ncbi:ATP-dependent RecD-like DNA helicase [Heliobacterium undosum]|uniref:ATP-dependent RecD2 DNA helicase n=2 Tax=Heliomicrobium undosum TaxID=121734 RepID=A0A845L7K4_9FIRM|nr:ATP-dependent RecD-like DNA helicase [Heliomicrobium undosum]
MAMQSDLFQQATEPAAGDARTAELKGIVRRIIFQKGDFYILAISPEQRKDTVTATGEFFNLAPNDSLILWGEWVDHNRFGKQLKVTRWERPQPTNEAQLREYLSSAFIKGVGSSKAAQIVNAYGTNALDIILEQGPKTLEAIKGIGPRQAEQIYNAIRDRHELHRVVMNLLPLGFTPKLAQRVYKKFGSRTVDIVKTDPYRLTEVDLIGFYRADQIAASVGLPRDSDGRIKAAIRHVVEGQTASLGHCWIPMEDVIEQSCVLLNRETRSVERQRVERALSQLCTLADDKERTVLVQNGQVVYPSWLYQAELRLAEKVQAMMGVHDKPPANLDKLILAYERATRIELAPEQRQACRAISQTDLLILTGGPGTGKTQTTRAVLYVFEKLHPEAKILLAAPTGRASRRMAEVTGREAGTLHRMLGIGKDGKAQYNRDNPLPCNLLVVDESSMMDLSLAYRVFDALAPGTKVLLVGDTDQLPSVGPGNVLKDLIEAGCPSVRLTRIFRQAEQSQIVLNAHRINRGQAPQINPTKGDFFFIWQEDPEKVADLILRSVMRLIQKGMGIGDIQVLCPMKKGHTGTDSLNRRLQEVVNPARGSGKMEEITYGSQVFRLRDKVIQTKNNYGKGVLNGDIGTIVSVGMVQANSDDSESEPAEGIVVQFNGQEVAYTQEELGQLALAYAITVHKSQGSEFKAVIVPITTQSYVMLARNLLYTAITRAREMAVLVGTDRALWIAVKNDKVSQRNTGLKEKIRPFKH